MGGDPGRCSLAALLLLGACSFGAGDYGNTEYRCGPDDSCPTGFRCEGGSCISHDGGSRDAAGDGLDAGRDGAVIWCRGNLVTNPSFELTTDGWSGIGGDLERITGGYLGDYSAEKCFDGSDTYYNVNDNPDTVMNPEVGASYSLEVWARSDTDQDLNATIRAKDSLDDPVEQDSDSIILKGDWAPITVDFTVEDPTSAVVEVYFSVQAPLPGDCFQIDAVCFTRAGP
jgi:hypothetical protein